MAHRFVNARSLKTIESLMTIAQELSISVAQLSLAWCRQKDFVGSVIFGATTTEQLEENLKSADITLDAETNERIDEISKAYPYPLG